MTSFQPLVPSVVVLHGALGSGAQMQPVVEALRAQRRYAEVLAVELPGHGQTPLAAETAFDLRTFALALQAAIHDAGLVRPVVFGYSMGGYVALLLELLAPGTIGGIVTLGTMLHWTPTIAAAAASRLDPQVIQAKLPAYAATLAARHSGVGGWKVVLTHTAAMLRELGEEPLLTNALLGSIHCPVHLLVGERDESVSLDDAVSAAAHLPRARASLLPDVPHPIEKVDVHLVCGEVSDLASQLTSGD